ncbi:large ribosomal subunit protein eL31-like [Saccopteryx leptura]|uniref:large ribosomal subunit protein eL31-like n=1 Tax=Saccopteryx leptura TaxID=249018 RepID=UPI00339CB758
MAPLKKSGKKKEGCSAISEAVIRENTINIHKSIHGLSVKKYAPQALREICKLAMKEMGTPDVHIGTKLTKVVWTKKIRNAPYGIGVWLSRKQNEDEGSPNKLYTLDTYISVTTLKYLPTVNVDEN